MTHKMQFHLANILTIGRLALVPFFLLFFILGWYGLAFFTFTIASLTDLVDGTIARLSKKHSQLGAFLDPLADKLLMLSAFSCLVWINAMPGWFLALVIIRDVIIMGGIAFLKIVKIEVAYEPFWSSKFTTLAFIILGTLSLGSVWSPSFQIGAYPIVDFAEGMMYITTVLIVITALQYTRKGIEILQAESEKHGSIFKYRH